MAFGPGISGAGQAASFAQAAGSALPALAYDLSSLQLTSLAFTVSFWMNAVSLVGQQDALTLTSTDGRTVTLGVGVHSSFLVDYESVKAPAYREVPATAGAWSMFTISVVELAASALASLTYVVYKDGVFQALLTFNQGATRSFASLVVGGSAFAGRVDDVRLYSAALNSDQIASLYNATKYG